MFLDPTLLSAYLVVSVTLAVSPGPDFMYVLANGLKHKTKGAVAAVLGIAAGSLFHSIIAAMGISVLIKALPGAFEIIKILGAVYLLYLGLNALKDFYTSCRRKDEANAFSEVTSSELNLLQIFKQGLITNILNPKMIIFFISLLPQFVNPDLGYVGLQIFTLGGIHNLIGSIFLIFIGVGSGNAAAFLAKSSFGRYLDLVAGLFFVGLAIRLFFFGSTN